MKIVLRFQKRMPEAVNLSELREYLANWLPDKLCFATNSGFEDYLRELPKLLNTLLDIKMDERKVEVKSIERPGYYRFRLVLSNAKHLESNFWKEKKCLAWDVDESILCFHVLDTVMTLLAKLWNEKQWKDVR